MAHTFNSGGRPDDYDTCPKIRPAGPPMTMTNLAGRNGTLIEVVGKATRSGQCEGLVLNILCHGKPVARYHLLKAIELMDDMFETR